MYDVGNFIDLCAMNKMNGVKNFLLFFFSFPFMILRAVVANGMFGLRSIEDWSLGAVIYLITLMFSPGSPTTLVFIVGIIAWLWCVFIWFVYRINCDRGRYKNFAAELRSLVESRIGKLPGDDFESALRKGYVRITFFFWYLLFCGAFLFSGIKLLFIAASAGK